VRIVALLAWYEERTDWLAEVVASLAGATVDHLIAVDGAYRLFPQARGASSSPQADTINAVARGLGLGCTVHVPDGPWAGNEVAKRDAMFRLAHAVADPGDWLWVIDADEVIRDATGVREHLEASPLDVAEVLLCERMSDGGPAYSPSRKLFRAQEGGIHVLCNHHTYTTADGRVLRGDGLQVPAEQLHDVRVEHRPAGRFTARLEAKRVYYSIRDSLEVEHVA
jgi:hypothetical protein